MSVRRSVKSFNPRGGFYLFSTPPEAHRRANGKTHFLLTTSFLILSLCCSGKVHPRVWAEHCDITVGCGYKRNNIHTQKLSYRGHKRSKMCSCVLLAIILLSCIRPPLLAVDCEEAMMAQACSHDAAHWQVSSGFLKEQIQTYAFDCQYKPVFSRLGLKLIFVNCSVFVLLACEWLKLLKLHQAWKEIHLCSMVFCAKIV